MLDTTNPDVLSYLRKDGLNTVVVAMNCTGEPRTISLNPEMKVTSVKTLATTDPSLEATKSLTSITVAPYASWIALIQ